MNVKNEPYIVWNRRVESIEILENVYFASISDRSGAGKRGPVLKIE